MADSILNIWIPPVRKTTPNQYITFLYVGTHYNSQSLGYIITSIFKNCPYDTWCGIAKDKIVTLELGLPYEKITKGRVTKLKKWFVEEFDRLLFEMDVSLSCIKINPHTYILTTLNSNLERLEWVDFIQSCVEVNDCVENWNQAQFLRWAVQYKYLDMPSLNVIYKTDGLEMLFNAMLKVTPKNLQNYEELKKLIKSNSKRIKRSY